MKMTTVSLSEEMMDRLRSEAHKRGTSMAGVIRTAIDEHLRTGRGAISLRDIPRHRSGRLLRPWTRDEVFDEMIEAHAEPERSR